LLPGNFYFSRDALVVAVAIQAFVLWGLRLGSAVAWWVATFFTVGMIVTITFMEPPPDVEVFLILSLSVVMAAILFTRDVRTLVETGGRGLHRQRFP
jgi:hypothetical protein